MSRSNNIPSLRFPEFDKSWKLYRIGELGEIRGGGTPSTSNPKLWNGSIPWISSSDLSENNINDICIQRFISIDAVSSSATKIIPAKSILIVSRVGVGKVAVNRIALCTSQDFANLIPENDNVYFLAQLIKVKTKRLLEFNQGTSIKGFVKSDLQELKLHLPSLPEQQKIADFLTAVDKKIQHLTRKKELFEEYKKGVMQKIFSREIRFKDENGNEFPEWEEKRLGEIAKFLKGKNLSKSDITLEGK